MGLAGRLVWVNTYSKKQCRSLFWKMRAAVKKAMKNGGKQQLKFQYDPSSYALNFDDGCCHLREEADDAFKLPKFQDPSSASKNVALVYVLWVKSK